MRITKKLVWIILALLLLASITLLAQAKNLAASSINRIYIPLLYDPNAASTVPTPVPSGYIANPGFEQGETGWTFNWNTPSPIITSSPVHSGTKAALLGEGDTGYGNGRKASITQSLTVPADKPYLTFWSFFESSDDCLAVPNPEDQIGDYVVVYVDNVSFTFWQVCEVSPGSWVKRSADMTAYAGQLIWLRIQFQSDLTIPSKAVVDDFQWSAVP